MLMKTLEEIRTRLEHLKPTLREEFKVLVNSEIAKVYSGNRDFAEFLTDFLVGKPFWLVKE